MCRRILLTALAILAVSFPVTGCKTSTATAPAALAPGYTDPADQQMGQILEAAHQFYVTIQGQIQSKAYVPSATEITALDSFAITLNSAETIYLNFHAGNATQAQAQYAVDQVTAAQSQLQTVLPPQATTNVNPPPANTRS